MDVTFLIKIYVCMVVCTCMYLYIYIDIEFSIYKDIKLGKFIYKIFL